MSLCGGIENGAGPTDEEFERNLIEYTEVIFEQHLFDHSVNDGSVDCMTVLFIINPVSIL